MTQMGRLRPYPAKGNTETKGISRDYKKVECDVCGFWVRRMDCQLVTDPLCVYQLGNVVCDWCLDEANPQIRPKVVEDVLVTQPNLTRTPRTVYGSLNDPSKL